MYRGETRTPTRASAVLKGRKLVLVVGISALLLLAGCVTGSHTSTSQEPVSRGGTLRFATNFEPLTLDPNHTTENGSGWTAYALFDQLVEYMPGLSEPQPGLAESWTISSDGLHYTFKLRQARFSNGQPVTAADVKFSLERFTTSAQCGSSYNLPISAIRTIDANTIRIDLDTPKPGLLYYLGLSCASVVPKATLLALGEKEFSQAPVGSGPFMVKRWVQGQELDLVRNPYYWHVGEPYLDGVTFLYIPDDGARILKLRSSGADIASMPFSQVTAVDGQSGIHVQANPSTALEDLFLNVTAKPLDEKVVRQALSYATPQHAINTVVFSGKAEVANSQIPRTNYWDPEVPAYPYDIAKAKSLLAQSSVPGGFDLTLLMTNDSVSTQLATILQSAWAQIGVKLHLQLVDSGTFYARFENRNYEAVLPPLDGVTADLPLDDEFVSFWLSTFRGWTGYDDPEFTRLGNVVLRTVDEPARRELFRQIQRVMMNDAPTVPIVFLPSVYGVSNRVQGFNPLVGGWWRLEQVWLAH